MSLYVIRTDAPSLLDGHAYQYATTKGMLAVWVDYGSARWVASHMEGARVDEIEQVPPGINHVLYTHVMGRPDPRLPRVRQRVGVDSRAADQTGAPSL